MFSDDTIQGLGTSLQNFLKPLFGSLINIASPSRGRLIPDDYQPQSSHETAVGSVTVAESARQEPLQTVSSRGGAFACGFFLIQVTLLPVELLASCHVLRRHPSTDLRFTSLPIPEKLRRTLCMRQRMEMRLLQ